MRVVGYYFSKGVKVCQSSSYKNDAHHTFSFCNIHNQIAPYACPFLKRWKSNLTLF